MVLETAMSCWCCAWGVVARVYAFHIFREVDTITNFEKVMLTVCICLDKNVGYNKMLTLLNRLNLFVFLL